MICLAWFYLRYKRLKLWDVIVWTVIALLTFRYAISRTGMIVILLIIFGMYLVRKKRSWILHVSSFRKLLLLGFLLMIGVSIFGTIFYSDQSAFWKLVDSVFTKKVSVCQLLPEGIRAVSLWTGASLCEFDRSADFGNVKTHTGQFVYESFALLWNYPRWNVPGDLFSGVESFVEKEK